MTANAGKVADAIDALVSRLSEEATTGKLTAKERLVLRLNEQYPKASSNAVNSLPSSHACSANSQPLPLLKLCIWLWWSLAAKFTPDSVVGAQDVGVLSAYFLNLIALDQGQVRHCRVNAVRLASLIEPALHHGRDGFPCPPCSSAGEPVARA